MYGCWLWKAVYSDGSIACLRPFMSNRYFWTLYQSCMIRDLPLPKVHKWTKMILVYRYIMLTVRYYKMAVNS